MDRRTDYLIENAIWECPDWCTRTDEEVDENEHFSAWATVLDLGGDNLELEVMARMVRQHWLTDHERDCTSRIEVAFVGGGAQPATSDPQGTYGGTYATLWASEDHIAQLAQMFSVTLADLAVEAATSCEDAEGTSEEWVWSFDGAEEHAAAQIAAEEAEQANAS